ncbi:MAG: PEP/pyruvate-binding domain-containing protein, partial [Planctomycetota bacterium]|nr:PEP/pyruvate-binding domain-containing protein [Planctomycetota bacterium]
GITLSHKVLRMRARPKILLATTFEEACEYYRRYRRNLLGVISDVRFRSGEEIDPNAGAEFARRVREDNPDVPFLLQSTDARNADLAASLGVSFLHKESPQIKHELERFMLDSFGFGAFIFRMPDGREVARAENLRQLRECLKTVPAESLRFHSDRNHFSAWLKARTEFRLAARLRPQRVSDYASLEEMRQSMIEALYESRRETYRDAVAHFTPETFASLSTFERIGGGSLGGKARGLAFLNMLLREHGVGRNLPDVDVVVPPTVVIGTELFDQFMDENDLTEIALSDAPDETIREAFLEARLPGPLVRHLEALIKLVRVPLAVRSSSLLEDSQHQPFAGVYETYMLPNSHEQDRHRLRELCATIRLVYASTFSARAKTYLKATPQRPEKEKMAVIIQHLIGRRHSGRFYPCFSGVAQSYNYYPFGRIRSQDGAARVALGLGMTVVEGRGGVRFCPKYPRHLPQFSSVDDILRNSQKTFAALPLGETDGDPHRRYRPRLYAIKQAQLDGTLDPVGSIYSHENHTIHDGMARPGTPVITFAGVLKHDLFPLPGLLQELLEIGTKAMITPIELEFAVNMERTDDQPRTFACLQMRPLAVMRELTRLDLNRLDRKDLLCQSPRAMGNGRIKGIRDVVCIVPDAFDRKDSRRTANAVADLNAFLRMENRPYLLIGPGRWGSADPWLGIPVNWGQIAGARIIVETGFSGLSVTPSEGSHFFHNMTAFHVGYMTVNPDNGEGMIDWDWLLSQQVIRSGTNGLRWIRLGQPLVGLINGRSCEGVIVKSEEQAQPGEPPA